MTSNALRSTIRYDEEIARWAIRLLANRTVINSISSSDMREKQRFFLPVHICIMILNLGIAGFILKAAFFYKPFDIPMIFAFITLGYFIEIPYKNFLAELVTGFIKHEFTDEELKKITILQMSVSLEKKYKTPCLVDTVTSWILLFRYGLIFAYSALLLIFIPFLQSAVALLGIVWAVRALSRSSIIADKTIR